MCMSVLSHFLIHFFYSAQNKKIITICSVTNKAGKWKIWLSNWLLHLALSRYPNNASDDMCWHFVPLHRPRHGDEELILRIQHCNQVFLAGRTDGPQRVGAAFQLCDAQVIRGVTLQPLQGRLTAAESKRVTAVLANVTVSLPITYFNVVLTSSRR